MNNILPFKAKPAKVYRDIYIEVSEAVVYGIAMYEATVLEQASDFPIKVPVATFRSFSTAGSRTMAEEFVNSHYKVKE